MSGSFLGLSVRCSSVTVGLLRNCGRNHFMTDVRKSWVLLKNKSGPIEHLNWSFRRNCCTVSSLVNILHNTPSPIPLLKHDAEHQFGIPFYFIEALESVSGKYHISPRNGEEELAVEEFRKKRAPPAGDQVFPNILLGNKAAAEDVDFLLDNGVSHLLNCAHVLGHWLGPQAPAHYRVNPDVPELENRGIKVLQLELLDKSHVPICDKFEETNNWMKEALDGGGKVLVNCYQGASRSATVVLAYLIQHHKMQVDCALTMVKKKRDIRPNNGFLQQLIELNNSCNK